MYLSLHLTTLSVFRCAVNETLAILGCYTLWSGSYRLSVQRTLPIFSCSLTNVRIIWTYIIVLKLILRS